MQERYLTPEEAAQLLKVSPKSIRQWLRTGELQGIKVGRLWRIRESDLAGILTPEETAERLSISPKTIRDWLRSGKLKGEKIGGFWRIRLADLQSFIDANSR